MRLVRRSRMYTRTASSDQILLGADLVLLSLSLSHSLPLPPHPLPFLLIRFLLMQSSCHPRPTELIPNPPRESRYGTEGEDEAKRDGPYGKKSEDAAAGERGKKDEYSRRVAPTERRLRH